MCALRPGHGCEDGLMMPADDNQQPPERGKSSARRRRNRGGSRRAQGSSASANVDQPPGPRETSKQPSRDRDGSRTDAGQRKESSQSKDGAQPRDPDRNWRELAGAAPSQVGVSGAMRARDLNRPTPEDLAAAERDVVIIRRQWQPPEAESDR